MGTLFFFSFSSQSCLNPFLGATRRQMSAPLPAKRSKTADGVSRFLKDIVLLTRNNNNAGLSRCSVLFDVNYPSKHFCLVQSSRCLSSTYPICFPTRRFASSRRSAFVIAVAHKLIITYYTQIHSVYITTR